MNGLPLIGPALDWLAHGGPQLAHRAGALAASWWWLLVVLAAAAVGFALLRRRAVHRLLADRVALEVRPSTSYDPREEEALRVAQQIAQGSRHALRAAFDAREGAAMRIALVSTDGRMAFRIEGPAAATRALAAQGLPGCEVEVLDADGRQIPPTVHLAFEAAPGTPSDPDDFS
ncbi:hypothetical protein BIV57_13545 [Mangrovactinospora gilvigrisea]|uniref:Uncharacterized protein n=1 Tax=Mangrovactinospora gilvigrisea TaxID=1428644 RepID=A0A1J7BE91_9ACTN|nr:hypothetical protein [Mangrovactinospora gilvigrisea]OIV37007.1 hypothetical protein BIV57_13545 [Mangrovactinospora gilvigrisea]